MTSALAPLREREFRLLFAGRVVSFAGSAMAPIALAFGVIELGGSAGDLGLVLTLVMNLAVMAASFAALRIATTSALVTSRHTAPGPTTSSVDVTFPASSTVILTRTVPPIPLSMTSLGGCSFGIVTIFREV